MNVEKYSLFFVQAHHPTHFPPESHRQRLGSSLGKTSADYFHFLCPRTWMRWHCQIDSVNAGASGRECSWKNLVTSSDVEPKFHFMLTWCITALPSILAGSFKLACLPRHIVFADGQVDSAVVVNKTNSCNTQNLSLPDFQFFIALLST